MITTYPQNAILVNIVFLLVFMGSCARLPDYAKPYFYQKKDPLPLNLITYRDLTRADFQAKEPPVHLKDHRERMNARTAVSIHPARKAKLIIWSVQIYNQQVHCGQIELLSFEAVMIPEESWWNPRLAKGREGYVLQHEQVHFALMEIAARRLTLRVAKDKGALTVFDFSDDAVKKRLMARVTELITESTITVLKEHTAFDEDTSMRYAPKDQQRWWKSVTTQLQNIERLLE